MELGSEYNLSLSNLSIKDNNLFKYLDEYPYIIYFDSGRSALKHLTSHFEDNDEMLLPEFICESVINCFHQKSVRFYKLYDNFCIDVSDLESKITSNTKAILLVHYFGAIQPDDTLKKMVRVAKEHDCILIEDTTHGIFSKPDTIGDYQVCSIRKWLPIPSGGVLYAKNDVLGLFNGVSYEKCTANERVYGMILKDLFLNYEFDCNSEYRNIFAECEEKLDRQSRIFFLSDLAKFIVSCTDVSILQYSRRNNYIQLKEALNKIGILPAIQLNERDCPIALPIKVQHRDEFRTYLMNNRIYCAVHWPFDGIHKRDRAFAYDCSNHLLSLPIDQRYGEAEISYMADMIYQYREDLLC